MHLTIDANILVSELDTTGIQGSLLLLPGLGTLYIAEYTWTEAMYILERRVESWVRTKRLAEDVGADVLAATQSVLAARCSIVGADIYTPYEGEARRRIPDDPDDWHTVALALTTETAIWTLDQKHFFGCGAAVWKTTVLQTRLVTAPQPTD